MYDVTNYNKAQMDDLARKIDSHKTKYNQLTTSLESSIAEMHNYWVEDPDAQKIYSELAGQFKTFKTSMDEGYNEMTKFEKLVDIQIERYTKAEQDTLSAING